MKYLSSFCLITLAVLFASNAGATIVGENVNADFSTTPYTLSLGSANQASYTLSFDNSNFNNPDSLTTGGSGTVASTSIFHPLRPTNYFTGSRAPFIDGSISTEAFAAFDAPTEISFSRRVGYLALKFDLDDGTHFGYAKIDAGDLLSYGYQSDPGTGIQAGATPTRAPGASVPEPSSWAMLVLGLALIGFGAASTRRRTAIAPRFASRLC